MSKDTNKQAAEFPVREGSEESSILHDKEKPRKNSYPEPSTEDKQAKNQPEFTEEQPNKKSPTQPNQSAA
jgi:hypothetical protein